MQRYSAEAFAAHRADFADIARAKLRQARHDHIRYSLQTERVVELLSDWCAGFADGTMATRPGSALD